MGEHWARDHPAHFYNIVEAEGGLVDVYLLLSATVYPTEAGREYDATVSVVRGIVPWDGLEDDIRARFDAWCAAGEKIDL